MVSLAIALAAILAMADLFHEAPSPTTHALVTSGQLAAPPAPEPDVPALTSAAANPSATLHAGCVVEAARQSGPPFRVVAVRPFTPVRAVHSSKPRSFPLLI